MKATSIEGDRMQILDPRWVTPTEMKHTTRLYGLINGKEFNLQGTGYGKPYEGFLDTNL